MTSNKRVQFIIDAQDNASKKFKSIQDHAGILNKSVNVLGKGAVIAAKGIVALSGALSVAGGFAVKSAAEFEQNRIAFETMLGGADEARKMLKEVSDFAAKTPFDLPQVVTGAKSLLAYNIQAEKILPTFKALGNIAAGVGTDKLPNLVLAFGQVKAATRLTGMELRQFTEAGVPLLTVLSEQMGKSEADIKDMVSAGEIGFPEVEKAIFSMSEEGGKFFNLMDRQSQTFSGVVSNIKDDIGRVAREIVGISDTGDIREGSIFFYLKDAALKLLELIDANKDNIVNSIQNFINGFISFVQGVQNARQQITGFFSDTNTVWVFIKDFMMPIIQDLQNTFKTAWQEITEAIKPIMPELKIVAQFLGVVLLGAIMVVIKAFSALIQIVTEVFKGIINIISGAIQFLEGIFTLFFDFLTGNWEYLDEDIRKIWDGLKTFLKGIAQVIFSPFTSAFDKFRDAWKGLINGIIRMWNNSIGKISISIPDWVPKIGGKEFKAPKFPEARAKGGPVSSGNPYIVGEQGPEMFVPNHSGTIIPNNQMGATFNFTFNGDISDKNQLIGEIKQVINRELELSSYGIG